jgi:O-antigen/teichoic acid export membrane protein
MKMYHLFKNIGIYTFSNVLNASIPFILLPLLTHYLKAEDYGILTNFNALVNLLIPFIGVNLMSSLQVIYVKRNQEFSAYVSSGIFLNFLLTIFVSLIVIAARTSIHELTGIPVNFIVFLTLYAFYNNIVEILLSIWRIEDKPILYGIFRILRTLLEFAIAVVLIVVYEYHFEGSIYAISISYGLGAAVAFILLLRRKLFGLHFKLEYIKHQLAYGLPLIPHVLSSVAILYTDKLMLSSLVNIHSNGVFSVGFTIGQIIGLLQNSFNQAWVPWVFGILKKNDEHGKLRIVKYTYLYIICILIAVVVLWLFTPIIYRFIGNDFNSSISVVIWIALGFAFNGMYKMISVYYFYLEKTRLLALISFITALVNIGVNFILIPKFGILGAALSTMAAMFIQFALTFLWSLRIIQMPWIFKK